MRFLAGLKAKLIIAGGVALLVLALITRNRQLKEKADDLSDYKQTRQRADRADVSRGVPSDDLEWMRRRAESASGTRGDQPEDKTSRVGYSEW